MKRVLFLVLVAACGSSKKAAVEERPELLETVTVMADRVCACETDKECIRAIRDEWDAQKVEIMSHRPSGAAFDAELLRLRSCGDAGGLTFWMPPPRE